jgi:hypothetical protein
LNKKGIKDYVPTEYLAMERNVRNLGANGFYKGREVFNQTLHVSGRAITPDWKLSFGKQSSQEKAPIICRCGFTGHSQR